MRCPKCKQETPDHSKTCQHCKEPLYPIQCYCGEWNSAEAKHCIQCQRNLTQVKKRIEYSRLFNIRVSVLAVVWMFFLLLNLMTLAFYGLKIEQMNGPIFFGAYLLILGFGFGLILYWVEMSLKKEFKKKKPLVSWTKRKFLLDITYLLLLPFLGTLAALLLGRLMMAWNLPVHLTEISRLQSVLPPDFLYYGLGWGAVGGIGGLLTGILLPSSGRHIYHSGSFAVKILGSVITMNIAGLIMIPKIFYGDYQEMGSYLQGFLISTAIGALVAFFLKKQLPFLGILFWKILKMTALTLLGFFFMMVLGGGIFYLLGPGNPEGISYWISFFLVALFCAELQAMLLNPMVPLKSKYLFLKKTGTEEDSSW